MIKSWSGMGALFFSVFLIIAGTWMFITPFLEAANTHNFNYGSLFFILLGATLLFIPKKIILREESISIRQIITGKVTTIPKTEIRQINIDEGRNSAGEIISSGRYRHGIRINIQFKNNFKKDLNIIPSSINHYQVILAFLRANYSKKLNEQIHESF